MPQFTEFDFSVRAHGAQASTFSELFAEVLHPVPAAGDGRPEPGADLHATLTVPFEVAAHRRRAAGGRDPAGAVQRVPRRRAAGRRSEGRCPRCEGSGQTRWARGHMVFSKACAACGGTGTAPLGCAARSAWDTGRAVRSEAVAVRMPPGRARRRAAARAGDGNAGRHGGATGDLYVTVQVAPHPLFRREGDDLLCTIPVAVHEAVLGARDRGAGARRPDPADAAARHAGRPAVPRRGDGACRRPAADAGDLVVEVRIVLPSAIDERSKELIREFGG